MIALTILKPAENGVYKPQVIVLVVQLIPQFVQIQNFPFVNQMKLVENVLKMMIVSYFQMI